MARGVKKSFGPSERTRHGQGAHPTFRTRKDEVAVHPDVVNGLAVAPEITNGGAVDLKRLNKLRQIANGGENMGASGMSKGDMPTGRRQAQPQPTHLVKEAYTNDVVGGAQAPGVLFGERRAFPLFVAIKVKAGGSGRRKRKVLST